MEKAFQLLKYTNFIYKIPFLQKSWIQPPRRVKKYILEICENFQKVDFHGAESKNFFQMRLYICLN